MFDLVTDEGNFPVMRVCRNCLSIIRIYLTNGLYIGKKSSCKHLMRSFLSLLGEFMGVEYSERILSKANQPDRYQGFRVVGL